MKKPRILMLITNYLPTFSGHAIYLQKVIPRMQERGYRVEVLTGDFGKYPPRESIDAVTVHRVPFEPKARRADIRFTLAILRFLFRHRKEFDILHVNGHMDQYGLLTIACWVLGKRIVMQMVLLGSDDPESLKSQYRFMRMRLWVLRHMDRFIHISKPIGESCRRARFAASKLRHIPQGVDTQRFCPVDGREKADIRCRLGLPEDKTIVTFVGAITHRKGVDVLVDAWQAVQQQCPEAELVLVGPCRFGDEDVNESALNTFVDGIRGQISQHALNVRMVGSSCEVAAFLQASDVFVLPSRKEGFGNVIIEAMACGVPAVVTYMDGVSLDTVTPGETGLVVHSCSELADALIDLIKDGERRKRLGANARQDALRRFDLENIVNEYLAVYDELF